MNFVVIIFNPLDSQSLANLSFGAKRDWVISALPSGRLKASSSDETRITAMLCRRVP